MADAEVTQGRCESAGGFNMLTIIAALSAIFTAGYIAVAAAIGYPVHRDGVNNMRSWRNVNGEC